MSELQGCVTLIDADGYKRIIPWQSITDTLFRSDAKLFGMSVPTILALRNMYLQQGGNEPVTETSIAKLLHGIT